MAMATLPLTVGNLEQDQTKMSRHAVNSMVSKGGRDGSIGEERGQKEERDRHIHNTFQYICHTEVSVVKFWDFVSKFMIKVIFLI